MNKLSKILFSLAIIFSVIIIAVNILIAAVFINYVDSSGVLQGDNIQFYQTDDSYVIKSDNGILTLDDDGDAVYDEYDSDDNDLDVDDDADDTDDTDDANTTDQTDNSL